MREGEGERESERGREREKVREGDREKVREGEGERYFHNFPLRSPAQ